MSASSTIELPSDRHREAMLFLSAEQVNDLADAIEDRYCALIYTAAYGGPSGRLLPRLSFHTISPLTHDRSRYAVLSERTRRLAGDVGDSATDWFLAWRQPHGIQEK